MATYCGPAGMAARWRRTHRPCAARARPRGAAWSIFTPPTMKCAMRIGTSCGPAARAPATPVVGGGDRRHLLRVGPVPLARFQHEIDDATLSQEREPRHHGGDAEFIGPEQPAGVWRLHVPIRCTPRGLQQRRECVEQFGGSWLPATATTGRSCGEAHERLQAQRRGRPWAASAGPRRHRDTSTRSTACSSATASTSPRTSANSSMRS